MTHNEKRILMNVCAPRPAGMEFLRIQDEYLREEVMEKGITDSNSLPVSPVNNRTVGPVVSGILTKKHCEQLAGCYRSC